MPAITPKPDHLARVILTIRDQKVILDADLAILYGVETRVLNQAVKRNLDRFPSSFRFLLDDEELALLRSQNVTSSSHGGRRSLPAVFTEHGALMAANILNSPQAVKMSIALIEAFVRLRQEFVTTVALARRLAEIENTVLHHDAALTELFRAIKPLLLPPPDKPRKRMGFELSSSKIKTSKT